MQSPGVLKWIGGGAEGTGMDDGVYKEAARDAMAAFELVCMYICMYVCICVCMCIYV